METWCDDLDSKVELPSHCELCPRRCGADRAAGQRGVCGADDRLIVARAALHMWEEPPISGIAGSGAVFFSHCPLRCVFCQNAELSRGGEGKAITVGRLAQIFLELQDKGALNINLVTPTHYLLQIKAAIDGARHAGLSIPIVYNTSGYETVEAIESLAGYVDIYLTDMKYVSSELSGRYSHAADYFVNAAAALQEMYRQVGCYTLADGSHRYPDPDEDDGSEDDGRDDGVPGYADGIPDTAFDDVPEEAPVPLARGVIVRHLMLPGCLEDSKAVVRHVFERYGDDVCLSLMNQYTPMPGARRFPELSRAVSDDEYDALIDYALDLGVENSFMQEGGTVSESFIPSWDGEGV